MNADHAPGRFGSGHSVRRIEDPSLVTGQGQFADDVAAADCTHLVFLRSPLAHARIRSIDTSQAKDLPGVVAIFTGADLLSAKVKPMMPPANFTRSDGSPTQGPPRHVLATDTVRHVGEAVAAVVATSVDAARAARDAIAVDYDSLPVVASIAAATAPAAPLVWPQASGNLAAQMNHGNPEATQAAFARAAHTVSLDIINQRIAPVPLEPRASLATHDAAAGVTTLRLSSQMPSGARNTVADLLNLPKTALRVVVGDVGGGFGAKTGAYPEDVVLAWAARSLGRSVRWCAERSEEFTAQVHGRDLESRAELALDTQGRVLALRVNSLANVGAYAMPTGVAIQLLIGPWVSTSIYDIDTIDIRIGAVLTHTAPTGAYRGAGRPEAIYIIERLMDAAARQIGLDAAELRRRNMIRPQQMPYRNAMQQTYDSGEFESITRQALELADWNGFESRAAESAQRGRLRGRGIASFLEWTGGNAFEERVTVEVAADGIIEIYSATQAMGQGIATTYAQLAVDVFGVPIENIRIIMGDTNRGEGFGSAGSRSIFTAGSAVQEASVKTVEMAKELAARELEASATDLDYQAGRFTVRGTDLHITLAEIAAREGGRFGLESSTTVGGPTWPNGCHICEVEIDPDTGTVTVDRYHSVNDIGRVINPMIVTGQIEGGAVQGVGQALCERIVHDESGQNLNASFLDYAMPRTGIVRHFETRFDTSVPCRTNPLGVKGVGEVGTIGATPTVVNAVIDAVARAGLGTRAHQLQMPLTSERVWRALQGEFI